jgi:hypothetical protein
MNTVGLLHPICFSLGLLLLLALVTRRELENPSPCNCIVSPEESPFLITGVTAVAENRT